jgi:magnesium transporter
MTPEYVSSLHTMTCRAGVTSEFGKRALTRKTIYTCYVTENRKLVGVVSVRSLLVADKSTLIGDIMHQNLIAVETTDDKEFVAAQFQKYGYLAIPVVDKENRLVGIVTIDDALDRHEDEATEDIEKNGGHRAVGEAYMKTGVFATYAKRIPWLLLLMISATFTSQIINSFETALKACILLTGFIR